MSTCVCVLSNSGERLMPTIRLGRVRHLLKDGKAKIIKHHPFTIQLLFAPLEQTATELQAITSNGTRERLVFEITRHISQIA